MKKLAMILTLLTVTALSFAQTPGDNADYWVDENGRFHQRIRWSRSNALYYDVEIEKRDTSGNWLSELVQRTNETSLEFTLPPGYYRYRIKSYNVMERLSGTTNWVSMRIYTAKNPDAKKPAAIELISGASEVSLRLEGRDLADGAKIYIVPARKGAAPVKPLTTQYSFDDTWIKVRFAASDVPRGRYNIVITNPGGLNQTINGVSTKAAKGLYDGVMVYLVNQANAADFVTVTNNYNNLAEYQPKPSAMGWISAVTDTFSISFKKPQNHNPRGSTTDGWWAPTNEGWKADDNDYYVLIIPVFWPSGVRDQGNWWPMWAEGKVSVSGSTAVKKTISTNPFTFSRADFKDVNEVTFEK
jgi:hypothetical protein